MTEFNIFVNKFLIRIKIQSSILKKPLKVCENDLVKIFIN